MVPAVLIIYRNTQIPAGHHVMQKPDTESNARLWPAIVAGAVVLRWYYTSLRDRYGGGVKDGIYVIPNEEIPADNGVNGA